MSSELLSVTTGNDDTVSERSAASRFALEHEAFLDWCKAVQLDYNNLNTHELPLPSTLQDLVNGAKSVPSWMIHSNAREYEHAKPRFATSIDALAADIISEEFELCSNDQDLSNDIRTAIVPILTVVRQNTLVQRWQVKAVEAETRIAIDNLNNHVWGIECADCIQYRMERAMKLPKTNNENAPIRTKVDASAFIRAETLAIHGLAAQGSCSSIVHESQEAYFLAPHWVNEYKRLDGKKRMSINQVILGLVSGLYQRRSLGFPHHFIFAMAHHSSTKLLVFAGTWKCSESSGTIVTDPGSQCESVGSFDKMVLYHMREFDISLPTSILQFYLLMKKTYTLARLYRDAIVNARYGPISSAKCMPPSPDAKWPPEEDEKSEGGPSKPRPNKRARLGKASGGDPGPQANCQDQSPNDSPMVESPTELDEKRLQVVGVVGMDHPLKSGFSRAVEQFSSDEIVKKYLSTSVNVAYDAMPNGPRQGNG
ncbi:hypothetical protein CTheo_8559 [Ceratobasidium theobromae]|uniref:Uncharacterized protein n=1 Tax=Ceratobasidium theobromae TaxID=1582974 RepID=A0A5N5Q9C3_9AGAM|nr:hypothetical protein CTheo_8559 [Ceratobasidium theobromae]